MNESFQRRQQTSWVRLLKRSWVLVAAGASLFASVCAASCGGDENGAATTERTPNNLNIITNSDIGRYPPNSPERALLMWFQAVQFRDHHTVRAHATDRAVSRAGKKLDHAVTLIGSSLGKPRIASTRIRGDGARVRVLIQSWLPGDRVPDLEVPATFPLVRGRGGWKLDDLSMLMETRAAILAKRRA